MGAPYDKLMVFYAPLPLTTLSGQAGRLPLPE